MVLSSFHLLPPTLDAAGAILLIGLSFFTSATTAAFSLGGGSMLIAVMSLMLPAAVAVPVHGFVQLGSNGGRAILRRAFIQWHFVGWFVLGSAIGAALGGRVATLLPDTVFKTAIGLFILYGVWAPKPPIRGRTPLTVTLAGGLTSAVGMVVGISGPLVVTFLRNLDDRRQIVGTHAFLMTMQNTFKVVTFTLLGFAFSDYLPLVLAMIASGFAGTALGGFLLDRLPEKGFRHAFRIVLTLVAVQLLWSVGAQMLR
ncbi:MAG TPA: sulfite exporter TauE/SafE family protein [Devosiaceae bacterium]